MYNKCSFKTERMCLYDGLKKKGEDGFRKHRYPHQTGGNDPRWKQQRCLVKRDPLITLACSSKGRWLL